MRLSSLAAVLLASLTGASAWATPAQDSVRRLAAILRYDAPSLRAALQAPQLDGQVTSLKEGIERLVAEKAVTAAAAKPVSDEAADLLAELRRSPRLNGVSIADKTLKLAEDAQDLLRESATIRAAYVPEFNPNIPPAEPAMMAALQKRAETMRAAMGNIDFDGGGSAKASPAALAPASVPVPRSRLMARENKLVYSAQAAYYQGALNPFLKSEHRRALRTDGVPGGSTRKAVEFFQEKKGLPKTGVIDGDTEKALLADFQERRHLRVTGALDETTAKALRTRRMIAASKEPVFFEGGAGDFEPKTGAQTIKNALATVYTPYLAKTKKQKKLEGPPIDHHDQAVCTLERYLDNVCPYVSVAIDPRLNVPNGTPLLIPEISQMAGKTVHFRIVDTGSKKRFKGTGHVDVATDSNQYSGYGQLISGHRFTLVLPEGLHPSEM